MRKGRFTAVQIIGVIKEQEAGLPTSELCRKHGLSPATFYKLKAKYGAIDLSAARRLKQLEDENAKLTRLLAAAMLDDVVLRDRLGKPNGFWPKSARTRNWAPSRCSRISTPS